MSRDPAASWYQSADASASAVSKASAREEARQLRGRGYQQASLEARPCLDGSVVVGLSILAVLAVVALAIWLIAG